MTQIFEGKLAEWGVYKYLILQNKNCTAPDINKDSAKKYGLSWVFQSKDPMFKKADDNDICIFCLVYDNNIEIILERPFKKLIFKDPKIPFLKGIKKVVYLEDNK